MEVDSLSNRIENIKEAYSNTSHQGLRTRLFHENKYLSQRLSEVFLIAKELKNWNKDHISFSSLLLEKCIRVTDRKRLEKNLFFL